MRGGRQLDGRAAQDAAACIALRRRRRQSPARQSCIQVSKEASPSSDGHEPPSSALMALPAELLAKILAELPSRDVAQAASVSRDLLVCLEQSLALRSVGLAGRPMPRVGFAKWAHELYADEISENIHYSSSISRPYMAILGNPW